MISLYREWNILSDISYVFGIKLFQSLGSFPHITKKASSAIKAIHLTTVIHVNIFDISVLKMLDILFMVRNAIRKFMCLNKFVNLTLEGPCIIFCNIYTFQRDTQCGSTDCLLMLRCQYRTRTHRMADNTNHCGK